MCCGHHYCDSCVNQWLNTKGQRNKKTCPHCRQAHFQSVLNKEKLREIKELQVYCIHKVKGCKWVGKLGAINKHLEYDKGCGYVRVQCSNRYPGFHCCEKMERRHLSEHLKHKCLFRQYTCEHCGYEDTYDAIAGRGATYIPLPSSILSKRPLTVVNHYDDCTNYPFECPNKCGDGQIKRKDMSAHRDSCELESLDCPFNYVGCTDKIPRREMDRHSSNNMQKHLLLLAKAHEKLACKVEELATK